MVLDYVLGHQDVDWFATEEDKVALFTTRFGVPALDLPQRIYVAARRDAPSTTRYFIHKLPILVSGTPPVVSLVWLATDVNGDAFEQFVLDHVRFLSHLPHWRIVALAPRHVPAVPACGRAFDRVVATAGRLRPADERDALRSAFTTLDTIDRDGISRVSMDEIRAFRTARDRFESCEFELLFERWKVHGDASLLDHGAAGFLASIRERRGALVTEQLAHSYDRFGTRAGVS
jgi:hypothetical protein